MTEHHSTQDNAASDAINLVLDSGLEGLPEAFTLLLNQAMLAERSKIRAIHACHEFLHALLGLNFDA